VRKSLPLLPLAAGWVVKAKSVCSYSVGRPNAPHIGAASKVRLRGVPLIHLEFSIMEEVTEAMRARSWRRRDCDGHGSRDS
jgi:hypothetical protein